MSQINLIQFFLRAIDGKHIRLEYSQILFHLIFVIKSFIQIHSKRLWKKEKYLFVDVS